MSDKQEKTDRNQNSYRWIAPSDDSLPPQVTNGIQDDLKRSITTRNAIPKPEEPPMSGMLTVPEKEYWTNRIDKRIEKRVEELAAADASLLGRLQHESHERALASLGLLERQKELDTIEQQKTILEERKRQIERSMLAHIRGVPVEDIDDYESHRHRREVDQAVKRRQAVHEAELLAESEIGQRILKLREEKENLVDAVWLAMSLDQIQELWSKMADLLNADPRPVEREVFAIIPREA